MSDESGQWPSEHERITALEVAVGDLSQDFGEALDDLDEIRAALAEPGAPGISLATPAAFGVAFTPRQPALLAPAIPLAIRPLPRTVMQHAVKNSQCAATGGPPLPAPVGTTVMTVSANVALFLVLENQGLPPRGNGRPRACDVQMSVVRGGNVVAGSLLGPLGGGDPPQSVGPVNAQAGDEVVVECMHIQQGGKKCSYEFQINV